MDRTSSIIHQFERRAALDPEGTIMAATDALDASEPAINVAAAAWLATHYCLHGRINEGLERLNEAVNIAEALCNLTISRQVWQALGRVHYATGDFETAAAVFLDLVAQRPETDRSLTTARLHNDLGRCLLELGDTIRGAVYLRSALTLLETSAEDHPEQVVVRRNLAAALRSVGRHRASAAWATEAVSCGLHFGGAPLAGALSTQARCALDAQDTRLALETIETLDALDAKHDPLPGTRQFLRALLCQQQHTDGTALWSELVVLEGAPMRWRQQAALELGNISETAGDAQTALAWYKRGHELEQQAIAIRRRITRHTLEIRLRLGQVQVRRMNDIEQQLNRSERRQTLERVGAELVHDLSNLVTVAQVSAEVARDKHDPATGLEALDDVLMATSRASELLRYLRKLAHPDPADREAVFVDQTLESMRPLLQRAVGDSVTLQFDLGVPNQAFHGQLSLFEQAVMNLCLNARDAMSNQGFLHIRTARDGRFIIVRVRDSGPGIPEDMLDQIFEPFFTTKGQGGTGLGLSSVRSFVQRSGGTIQANSRIGAGATFEIRVPVFEQVPSHP